MSNYKHLSDQQINSFVNDGFVVIRDCFNAEQAQWFIKDIWTRLGYDPDDVSTWKEEKINMPSHKKSPGQKLAPEAWGAMCELVAAKIE